ncbi:hypothetical protein [Aquirufa salirivi]|uniref:Uncharacterized protein n=1 Tax=Aquirufa salirivi TaxID=3104729 RepID=A0ABW8RYQ1_9BACT
MVTTKKENNPGFTTFEEHLENRYGKTGSVKRIDFEIKAHAFTIGEVLKEERCLC